MAAEVVLDPHHLARGHDLPDLFRQLPQHRVREPGVVARQQARGSLEVDEVGLHPLFLELRAALLALAAHGPVVRREGDEDRPHPDHHVARVHGLQHCLGHLPVP